MEDFELINDFRVTVEVRLQAARRLAATYAPDMSAACEADLHCHSFYSDGYNSPSMLVFEAFRRRMRARQFPIMMFLTARVKRLKPAEFSV
jgi:hypothetical protein